jgi:aspartate/methionine/tyrosine aminotransferase
MFARRTNWELSENPLSLALARRKALGREIFDLTESNPTSAGIGYPAATLLGAFNDPDNLVYAPEPAGLWRAREAVSAYFAARGTAVSPGNITLTASTSEAYSFLFRLLADPGDHVLLPAPSYPLFSYLAGISDIEAAYYQLYFDGASWRIDFESIVRAARSGRARAVVLVSPNNPTGSFIAPDELEQLNGLCAHYGMAIISDEVFSDYLSSATSRPYVSLASNAEVLSFALGGLSKALALPQMKLGWIAANGPAGVLKDALGRLEVIADTFLSVNTPVQNACVQWLPQAGSIQGQIMRRVEENRAFLARAAAGAAIFLYPADGGWYAVLKAGLREPEDQWAVRLLEEQGVYVHPGFYFDFPAEGHIVLSLLPRGDVFRAGVERLLKALS